MKKELETATENLYAVFGSYPFKPRMEGCPCCVSDSDKEEIHTKALRQLDGDDLSRYAFKAMTTWGDADDFKHYLPRIFELLSTTDFAVDTFVVLGKLDYGQWTTWPEAEQSAIKAFLLAWWADMTTNRTYFDLEAFVEIYKLTGDLEPLLSRWTLSVEDNSFSNYVDFVFNYYTDLTGKTKEFKALDSDSIQKLIDWTRHQSNSLESGFFYFVDKDKGLAEKISTAQYILEHTL